MTRLLNVMVVLFGISVVLLCGCGNDDTTTNNADKDYLDNTSDADKENLSDNDYLAEQSENDGDYTDTANDSSDNSSARCPLIETSCLKEIIATNCVELDIYGACSVQSISEGNIVVSWESGVEEEIVCSQSGNAENCQFSFKQNGTICAQWMQYERTENGSTSIALSSVINSKQAIIQEQNDGGIRVICFNSTEETYTAEEIQPCAVLNNPFDYCSTK